MTFATMADSALSFGCMRERISRHKRERERLGGIFAFYQVRVSVNCAEEEGNFDRRERDVCLSETSLAPLK